MTHWHFERPEDGRSYALVISADLFGGYLIRRSWGSRARAGQSYRTEHVGAREDLQPIIDRVISRRAQRGYRLRSVTGFH